MAFDPAAVVFAVGSQQLQEMSLYSLKNYERKPFLSFKVASPSNVNWAKLEFANNGQYILLSTDGDAHYIFDAYQGTQLSKLVGHVPLPKRKATSQAPAAFSIDGKFVVGGSADNRLCIWSMSSIASSGGSLAPIGNLACSQGLPMITAFSPRSMLLATANTELTFWLPDMPRS